MPYNSAFPTEHTEILAEEFRDQFHGLKDLIDAVPAGPPGPKGDKGDAGAPGQFVVLDWSGGVQQPPYNGVLPCSGRYAISTGGYIGSAAVLADGAAAGEIVDIMDVDADSSATPFQFTGQNGHAIEGVAAGMGFLICGGYLRFIYLPSQGKWRCCILEPAAWKSGGANLYPGARRLAGSGATFYLNSNNAASEEILLADDALSWAATAASIYPPASHTINGAGSFVANVTGAVVRFLRTGATTWRASLA